MERLPDGGNTCMKSISFPTFFLLILVMLITAVVFTGCTGTPRSADGIVSGYKSHISAINDYSVKAVQVFSSGSSQDLEIRYKRPYQYLIKHETGPGGRTWTVAVQNLTYTRFEPASHTADILPIHNPETCFPPIADPNRLAFPVLFSGAYALSDSGVETVNGRDAYRIDAINSGPGNYFGEGTNGSVRIWIDRESWLVTRIQARDSAGNLKNSFEVKNFTTNTGIPDSEFTITYPNGTKIVHPNQFC
jgi:outer membrane lipoprotein-sorting protein